MDRNKTVEQLKADAERIYWQFFGSTADITVSELSAAIEQGMLPITDLEHNRAYVGHCRNASVALWDRGAKVFTIMRRKHGVPFADFVAYPWPGEKHDVFVPTGTVDVRDFFTGAVQP